MKTVIIFDGLRPTLWSHVEPFMYDLEDKSNFKVFETGKGDAFWANLENALKSIKLLAKNSLEKVRIIFVLDTSITLTEPLKNYLSKRIECFEDVLSIINMDSFYEIHFVILDYLEREQDGQPRNENAQLAHDMDLFGFIKKDEIRSERSVFVSEDFSTIDKHWHNMLTSEGIEIKSEDLLYNELKERQSIISNKAKVIIEDMANLFDALSNRIVLSTLNNLSNEERRILKLKILGKHDEVSDGMIKEHLLKRYLNMRDSFVKYLNEFKIGDINIEPSLKLKQILRYEVSLVSKCYERRVAWFKMDSNQVGYLQSMLKFILLIRNIASGNDSLIMRGKVNYCEIDINKEELSSFLKEYLCVLKSSERYVDEYKVNAGNITTYICPIFLDGFSTNKHIEDSIELSNFNIEKSGTHFDEIFNHSLFFNQYDFLKWSEYLENLEMEVSDINKEASIEKASIKLRSNTMFEKTEVKEVECEFEEVSEYINKLKEIVNECQIKAKNIKHTSTNLEEGFWGAVKDNVELVKVNLSKKIGKKACLISILISIAGFYLFYINIQGINKEDPMYSLIWLFQMVLMFCIIEAFIMFSKNKVINNLVSSINIAKHDVIKKKKLELNTFCKYLGFVSIIKMSKKYIDIYQKEIDSRYELSNVIKYHKQAIVRHINICEKLLDSYKISNDEKDYRLYNIGIDFNEAKDVVGESIYSPFTCSKVNEAYELAEKNYIQKGEKQKKILGEIKLRREEFTK